MTISSTQAWFPEDAVLKIENQRTGSISTITTEVTNFSDGGGDKSTESVAHFGGAFLVVTKPQEDYEVEFEVDVIDTRWMEVISGNVTERGGFKMVVSGGIQDLYKIKAEWDSPTTTERYKILFYNARGVTFEKDNAADDRLTGTMSFTLAPTDSNGSGQRIELETSDDTDSGIGSAITGSYGSYEAYYDSLYSYSVGSLL